MDKVIQRSSPLHGVVEPASDKSISHRALLFSALAQGEGIVRNFLVSNDTMSTVGCLQKLGVPVSVEGSLVRVRGAGLEGLQEPAGILDCGNSGTSMRLLTGVLASRDFLSILSGDESLNSRPMRRVTGPLRLMGAEIYGRANGEYPPLVVNGGKLKGITYDMPVASAQVKSALLLAGLGARGDTIVTEPFPSRDHSERMLKAMGADIEVDGRTVILHPGNELSAQEFTVPADISSAAFFMVAASIVAGSELLIKSVGINPTRAGILKVLERMGADIKLENRHFVGGEPVADILVKASLLEATAIEAEEIPALIDELPVIAVAMALSRGESRVSGAGELRVKETDRIAAICSELSQMGVRIQEKEDGFVIKGGKALKGARVNSHGDHRIAMSLAVAGLAAEGETWIANAEAVNISYPEFWQTIAMLTR